MIPNKDIVHESQLQSRTSKIKEAVTPSFDRLPKILCVILMLMVRLGLTKTNQQIKNIFLEGINVLDCSIVTSKFFRGTMSLYTILVRCVGKDLILILFKGNQ